MAVFTGDFIEECSSFPNGVHDDQVDCMSQALNRFIYYPAAEEEPDPYIGQVQDFLNYGG